MKKRYKVMMVETAGHGKLCHYTYSLCYSLSRFGCDVTLVTSKDYELDDLPREFKVLKLFPGRNALIYPFYFFKFISYVREIKPDVIHFQWFPSAVLGLIFLKTLKRLTEAKTVYTPHNILPHKRRFYFVGSWAGIYREVDSIIAHSRYNRAVIADLFDIDARRISVIPDLLFFDHITGEYNKEESRKYLNLQHDSYIILFFGYINRRKGIELLINTFKEVKASLPASKLVIAGKPEEDFSYYLRLIKQNNLYKEVILDLRYIPFQEMMRYFASADVVVLPYQKVCHSPVVQLARSFRIPVVTTELACGEDEEGMFVVNSESKDKLKEAIIHTLTSDEGSKKEDKPTSYTWQDIASLTFEVYNRKP